MEGEAREGSLRGANGVKEDYNNLGSKLFSATASNVSGWGLGVWGTMDHAIVGYSSVGDEDEEGSLGAPGMGEGKKANSRRATSMAIPSGFHPSSISHLCPSANLLRLFLL